MTKPRAVPPLFVLLILLALVVHPAIALNASAGPTACSSASGSGNWATQSSACASDDARAIYTGTSQDVLTTGGYGFAVPAGSTILGIEVTLECQGGSSTTANRGLTAEMTKDGSTGVGSISSTYNCPLNSDGTNTFGSSSDLWGSTWTAPEVNASTFGVRYKPSNANTGARRIDSAKVTVYWTVHRGIVISELRAPGGELLARRELR